MSALHKIVMCIVYNSASVLLYVSSSLCFARYTRLSLTFTYGGGML